MSCDPLIFVSCRCHGVGVVSILPMSPYERPPLASVPQSSCLKAKKPRLRMHSAGLVIFGERQLGRDEAATHHDKRRLRHRFEPGLLHANSDRVSTGRGDVRRAISMSSVRHIGLVELLSLGDASCRRSGFFCRSHRYKSSSRDACLVRVMRSSGCSGSSQRTSVCDVRGTVDGRELFHQMSFGLSE